MLTLKLEETESYDETKEEFVLFEEVTLHLEYSLVALSKWEEDWEKPFLSQEEHTTEETVDFIRCMCLDDNIAPEVFTRLGSEHFEAVNAYVNRRMVATYFPEGAPKAKSGETITAPLIYYWMTKLQIPWEAQHWHLEKLFTLIKVFDLKDAEPKKMSKSEAIRRTRELNARRRAEFDRRMKGDSP